MKRFFIFFALFVGALSAHSFDFDGIDLNSTYIKVAREISKRGYIYDNERNCLKGNCQGTEIYLSINYIDVTKKDMVGQLIVDVPLDNSPYTWTSVTTIFNVVYHLVGKTDNSITYQVDRDGTQLVVSQKDNSIILTYNTPYYKQRK